MTNIQKDRWMSEKIKIAYILTPITFGGSERVSLNFLKSVDRKKFDINPIIFLDGGRPNHTLQLN